MQPMKLQNGGSGGFVVCLGVGGLVDLAMILGLQAGGEEDDPSGGVEVWLIDARRPWNLGNVFGGNPKDLILKETSGNGRFNGSGVENGRLQKSYKPGQGGIIVYDDGDIDEDLAAEREAYYQLAQMPDVEDDMDEMSDSSGAESDAPNGQRLSKKRKSWSDRGTDVDESDSTDDRPRQKRRSSSVRRCQFQRLFIND